MKQKKSKILISALLFCFLLQTLNPYSVRAFTIGEEREVGEKLLYAVRSAFPIIGDPDLHQYINALGQEVLEVAGIQFFEYRFFIVESTVFNAFAAPSGLIFFYSELIESMQSEDELISVIAHEIGHVVKRHLASRIEKSSKVSLVSLGIALAAIALGGGSAGAQAIMAGSLAAGQSAQLYFSRQDEIEADLLAYNWMKKMKRNPEGQRDMLRTMRKITRYRMGQVPQYLLTHPNPEARLEYVESLIDLDGPVKKIGNGHENFEFLRFKYRILSIAPKNDAARAYLSGFIRDTEKSEFEKTMAQYGLALLDRKEKNYQQCLEILEKVIEQLPDKRLLKIDKAVVLAEMGLLADAKKLLEKAVREDPFNMYATFNLAKVLYQLKDLDRAEQLFRDVSYDLPEYSLVYYEIGKILSEKGDDVEARFFLGKYNLYEGKLDLATSNFRQVKKSGTVSESTAAECEKYLKLIKRLKKG